MRKIILIAVLLLGTTWTWGQRGLLLLDYERNDSSFDLFLPCDIDSNKTLTENIKRIKADTAKWISLSIVKNYDDIISKSIKVENEGREDFADDIRYLRVIAVNIEIDATIDGRQFDRDSDFGEYRFKLFGRIISSGYDARQNYTLSRVTILATR